MRQLAKIIFGQCIRDAGIELVRLGDEPRLFWHKSNSNDPDRNVWSISDFSLGFRNKSSGQGGAGETSQ